MTKNATIDYLRQYRSSIKRTNEITAHLSELHIIAENLKNEEGQNVRLDKAVIDLVDAQNETAAELEKLCCLREKIISEINAVPDETMQEVLYHRYILGKKWEQIAIDMNYHYVSICRIHGRALSAISKIMKNSS